MSSRKNRSCKCGVNRLSLIVPVVDQGEVPMSTDKSTATPAPKSAPLSLDTWAVIAALLLALAVRFDILKNVSW
jgi:hypothetical protein